MRKRIISAVLALTLAGLLLCSCQRAEATAVPTDEGITLKVFSNLPDRKNGEGLAEQMVIDDYEKENPGVHIQVEALEEEAYKIKFRAYVMNGMPDIVSIWGQPGFLNEVLDAGILSPLNSADYEDYGFIDSSLDGFKKEGVLYGLPRSTDMAVFYYNKKMFEENGWRVPDTYEDLLALAGTIRAAGKVPVVMDGGDGWPLAIYMTDLINKINGECKNLFSEAVSDGDFTAEPFTQAAELMRKSAQAGLFQEGYDVQDYAAAMNLFTSGQAAMFYMGSWEAPMSLDTEIPEEIRSNIRAFSMPVVGGGKGSSTNIAAWNGGGYAVSYDSAVREEAIRFLNFMFRPDELSKYSWENGVGMSAQDQSAYMDADETPLQRQFVTLLQTSTGLSGTPLNDCGPSALKTLMESEIQAMTNGTKSTEEFFRIIGGVCE